MIKTLWLLECRDTRGYWHQLFTLYAIDKGEAKAKTESILEDNPHLSLEKLVEFPHGFVIMFTRLPGYIQA